MFLIDIVRFRVAFNFLLRIQRNRNLVSITIRVFKKIYAERFRRHNNYAKQLN